MKPRLDHQQNLALTLTEVLVILAAIIALVIFAGLPLAKAKAIRINCLSNLKAGECAFRLWAGDNNDKYPMAVSVTNGGVMELMATGNVVACFQVMSNELSTPKILYCPADKRRTYATNFSIGFSGANISYFVNADTASEMYPQMILLGDDNLLANGKPVQPGILNLWTNVTIAWTKDRHRGCGNLGLADGSAQQVTSDGLNALLRAGGATNRWVIP